ncbi:SMI1/KNR4 family protein [Streptomyces sp. NPDC059785]|uniref:SMI1/KNR4 family protein n=1 Tax=Streptomyces sp. NPDC059785 TaxID=3346945 RepID=UPI00364F562A
MLWIETLRNLMPPHAGAGDLVDWEAVERSWGHPFPRDYKDFMALYGGGTVSDYLGFLLPEPRTAEGAEPVYQGMEAETRTAESFRRSTAAGDWLPSQIIAWGVDASADILCWRVTGKPEAWPVLVWNQDDATWSEYPCGMVEFLCRLFREDCSEIPLGSVGWWGESPCFLHAAEEGRLRAAGIDSWTGRLDPFAGMFGE